jgi:hypothetical protein
MQDTGLTISDKTCEKVDIPAKICITIIASWDWSTKARKEFGCGLP